MLDEAEADELGTGVTDEVLFVPPTTCEEEDDKTATLLGLTPEPDRVPVLDPVCVPVYVPVLVVERPEGVLVALLLDDTTGDTEELTSDDEAETAPDELELT